MLFINASSGSDVKDRAFSDRMCPIVQPDDRQKIVGGERIVRKINGLLKVEAIVIVCHVGTPARWKSGSTTFEGRR